MVKIVDKGERFCSITLDGSESSITFQEAYLYFSVQNNSDSVVYISLNRDIVPNADGVMAVNAGSSVLFGHMKNANHFFVKGTGLIQIAAANEPINFFVNASTSGGGGTEGDYYTKIQSDTRYAQKSEIPTTLPANGGNADTVDGKHAENFIYPHAMLSNVDLNTILYPCSALIYNDCTNTPPVVSWGTLLCYSGGTGSHVQLWTTASDSSMFKRHYDGEKWSDWKEISTTPIKSTPYSSTTDDYSICRLWGSSENKIPIAVLLTDMLATIFYSSLNSYAFTVQQPDTHIYKPNIQVSGTVYYIEV